MFDHALTKDAPGIAPHPHRGGPMQPTPAPPEHAPPEHAPPAHHRAPAPSLPRPRDLLDLFRHYTE